MLTAAVWPDADENNRAGHLTLCGMSYTPSENMLEINKK